MYRISEISVNVFKYRCVKISALNLSYTVTCRDDDKVVELSFPVDMQFTRDRFMNYIRKFYGIEELSGVGKDFLYAFDENESELLSYLTYNGYVEDLSLDFSLSKSLHELKDSDHLAFVANIDYLTLVDVLYDMQKNYTIHDNLLIVNTTGYLSYKISDVDKFNRLLTKLIVLRRKNA